MSVAYTCDMCGRSIPSEEVGRLIINGIDPVVPGRRGQYFREQMELCPVCAKGAFRAIKALAEKGKP